MENPANPTENPAPAPGAPASPAPASRPTCPACGTRPCEKGRSKCTQCRKARGNPAPAPQRPAPARPAGAVGQGVGNTPDAIADAITATIERNAHASTGAEAAPMLNLDAAGQTGEGGEPMEALPPEGVPAGDVASIAVEGLDNIIHALNAEYAMTQRERSTMTKSLHLMPHGATLPWYLGVIVAALSWGIRVYIKVKTATAKAAPPPTSAPAPVAAPAAADAPPAGETGLGNMLGGAA